MKNKIISISFSSLLIIFSILNILIPDKDISISERRKLQQMPDFKIEDIISREYMKSLDKYVLDQFILRDNFREIKSNVNYNVLNKLDNNGIYLKENHIFKTEYPTNKKSIQYFIKHINSILNRLNKDNQIYYSIIPDKNYYLSDKEFLNIDYNLLYKLVKEGLDINYIELKDILNLNDFYETDTHWKQEYLYKVAKRLGDTMGYILEDNIYDKNNINDFYGVYYGQAALNRKPEIITYLTNNAIKSSVVKYYEDKEYNDVYITNKTNSVDKYDLFLNGASAFIEITNPINKTNKELIIFRDSFSSSLAPLLIEAYSKITLIDTRYISISEFLKLIEFEKQDILFLYSTSIINNSFTLKTDIIVDK